MIIIRNNCLSTDIIILQQYLGTRCQRSRSRSGSRRAGAGEGAGEGAGAGTFFWPEKIADLSRTWLPLAARLSMKYSFYNVVRTLPSAAPFKRMPWDYCLFWQDMWTRNRDTNRSWTKSCKDQRHEMRQVGTTGVVAKEAMIKTVKLV